MKTVKLGDVLPFHYGKNLPAPKRNHEGSIPVISSAGVIDHHDQSVVSGPVVVIGRKGSVGSVFYSQGPCWPTDTAFYVQGSDRIDIRFAYYFLKNQPLSRMNNDSAVPGLNRGDAEGLVVSIPGDVEYQRQIAGVLGALDDKIAANNKILKISDSLLMAKYQATPLRGDRSSISDVASIGGGGTPSTKNEEFWGGVTLWATPTDVTRLSGSWLSDSARKLTDSGVQACSSPIYPIGSILMTSRATIGATCIAGAPMAVNQGFIVVQPRDKNLRNWLFAQIRLRAEEFIGWANGATFLELPKKIFRGLPFHAPTSEGLREFNEIADPLLESSRAIQNENQKLARTRDELLPLLMDGRITVKDAERVVEEA